MYDRCFLLEMSSSVNSPLDIDQNDFSAEIISSFGYNQNQ